MKLDDPSHAIRFVRALAFVGAAAIPAACGGGYGPVIPDVIDSGSGNDGASIPDGAVTGVDVTIAPDGAVTGIGPAPDASDATTFGCDACGISVAPDAHE